MHATASLGLLLVWVLCDLTHISNHKKELLGVNLHYLVPLVPVIEALRRSPETSHGHMVDNVEGRENNLTHYHSRLHVDQLKQ